METLLLKKECTHSSCLMTHKTPSPQKVTQKTRIVGVLENVITTKITYVSVNWKKAFQGVTCFSVTLKIWNYSTLWKVSKSLILSKIHIFVRIWRAPARDKPILQNLITFFIERSNLPYFSPVHFNLKVACVWFKMSFTQVSFTKKWNECYDN